MRRINSRRDDRAGQAEPKRSVAVFPAQSFRQEDDMGLGRGALLWLLGVPLPIILLLAFFWH
jgi:hypothetical protein